ncbi:MAG: serine/threonine protein kinase, partial [Ktedonobacteraceae bacterium]|nr:serine/threonine protein kinase [Ktedonobacteraceae bacterium]
LKNGALPLVEVRQLFSALVQAIAYIHKRGVVHRDLKPSNILLDKAEDSDQVYVRLIDFGIASIAGSAGLPAAPPLTTNGREMGTLAYMAPERLEGIAAPSNDIYSLGIILYQMLTGSIATATRKIGVIPAPLEAVVDRCTQYDPADRFSSADELLQAFERACQEVEGRLTGPTERLVYHGESHPVSPETAGPLASGPFALMRPDGSMTQQGLLIHRAETIAPSEARVTGSFSKEDYDAPTSFANSSQTGETTGANHHLANEAVLAAKPTHTQQKRKKRTLVGMISLLSIVLIVVIAGTSYLLFISAITATITVAPKVQSISKVLTMTARPGQQAVDAEAATLPVYSLTRTKSASRQGATSKPDNCFFDFFCKPIVSPADVDNIASQIRPTLQAQIRQELQSELQRGGYTPLGNVSFIDTAQTANPPVGTPSQTVTVTLTEQGMQLYIKTEDVRSLARQLLRKQVPEHYVLIDSLTQMGQPVLQSVNSKGEATLAIGIGARARYQLSQQELDQIQYDVQGMTKRDVRAYLEKNHPGLDMATFNIHLSYGDTLPRNVGQIKVTAIEPTSLSPVQVPPVQGTPIGNLISDPVK